MRSYEHTTENGVKRSVIQFDSFHELLATSLEKDTRTPTMRKNGGKSQYGVDTMEQAHELARKGLPHVGIDAIKLASNKVVDMQGEIIRPQFYDQFDVSGAVVDMGRYMEGTPECMVEYYPVEKNADQNIVCLIMNVSYNAFISTDAITKNGQAMMALVEAIELNGKQAEIWTDMNTRGSYDGARHRCRTAVRLKRAGEPFDVGMFMYALTHPSYLRCLIFNVMANHPESYKKACSIRPGGSYGSSVTTAENMDDFPPYSIYIPVINDSAQAGRFVTDVLSQLGLMAAA